MSRHVPTTEEQQFLQALDKLKANQQSTFRDLRKSLAHHPLDLFLEYRYLIDRLDQYSKVSQFLENENDTYYANRLRKRLLKHLGKYRQWQRFLNHYKPTTNEELQCYYLTAKFHVQGSSQQIFADATKLWLKGSSVSDACDAIFDELYKQKVITSELVWQRILLAAKKRNMSLAGFLSKKLKKTNQLYFKRLKSAHTQAEKTLKSSLSWTDNAYNRAVIQHALIRYSRKDTQAAWQLWRNSFSSKFGFTQSERRDIVDQIALRAAWRHLPIALDIFQQIPTEQLSEEALEWRVRTAIRYNQWNLALQYIPAVDTEKEEWRYWKARALHETGKVQQAKDILQTLALNTSYYGFISADNQGLEYQFSDEPVIDEKAAHRVEQLELQSAFQRIKHLFDLGMTGEAYSEWMFEVQKMSDTQKRVAARLAHNWQWHFTAIVTTARAKHFADLELRFPLLYTKHIYEQAEKYNIPPSLIYGIIRRESAFRETAVSPAGALGLMQLMPKTAKMVAKKMGKKKPSKAKIKEVEFNISLGSHYLKQVLDRYQSHEILATASYNAGPSRVKSWLPKIGEMPADVWIDSITFDETRKYVKAVHFYSIIFDWKDNGKVDFPLKYRMKPVFSPDTNNSLTVLNPVFTIERKKDT